VERKVISKEVAMKVRSLLAATCPRLMSASLCALLLAIPGAHSEDYLPSTDLYVELGTGEGGFATYPDKLSIEVGQLYRLIVRNFSQSTHVLMAPELSRTAVTTEIQRFPPKRISEEFGSIAAGIDMRPDDRTELYLVPFKQGTYKLFCEDDVHTESGLELTITVSN
jgi:uncharacterized cupredoxin-like copper-binding protein